MAEDYSKTLLYRALKDKYTAIVEGRKWVREKDETIGSEHYLKTMQ